MSKTKTSKKILSLVMTLAMLLTLVASFGLMASADEENITYATGFAVDPANGGKGVITGLSDTAQSDRKLAAHSLYAPDAESYTDVNGVLDNKAITSLRYYGETGLVYTFEDAEGNTTIINSGNDYDLVLAEATVGAWHPEAVEITLYDVNGDEGNNVVIGWAYNNIGVWLIEDGYSLPNAIDGQFVMNEGNANYTKTYISFPDYIESASAVKLVDKTAEAVAAAMNISTISHTSNVKLGVAMADASAPGAIPADAFLKDGDPINVYYVKNVTTGKDQKKTLADTYKGMYKGSTYTEKKDGFDLDAVGVFIGEPKFHGELAIVKFLADKDGNFVGDWNDDIEVLVTITGDNGYTDTALVGALEPHYAIFSEVPYGTYAITETAVDGYTQTYGLGLYAVLTSDGSSFYIDGYEAAPEIGNASDPALGSLSATKILKVQERDVPGNKEESVTGKGDKVGQAWFQYSTFNMADVQNGGQTAGLISNKTDFGTYTVTYDDTDDTLVVDINTKAGWLVRNVHASVSSVAKFNGAPGQNPEYGNVTLFKMPASGLDDTFYIYLHFEVYNAVTGALLDMTQNYLDATDFNFTLYKADGTAIGSQNVAIGRTYTWEDLEPGEYYIVEAAKTWIFDDVIEGFIGYRWVEKTTMTYTVVANETTNVDVVNVIDFTLQFNPNARGIPTDGAIAQ